MSALEFCYSRMVQYNRLVNENVSVNIEETEDALDDESVKRSTSPNTSLIVRVSVTRKKLKTRTILIFDYNEYSVDIPDSKKTP